jgi:hypothetical protein
MEPLKSCPFCGSRKLFVNHGFATDVECQECGASRGGSSDEEAEAAWNRRAQDVRGEAMREAAKICNEYASMYADKAATIQAHTVAGLCANAIRAAAGDPPKELTVRRFQGKISGVHVADRAYTEDEIRAMLAPPKEPI